MELIVLSYCPPSPSFVIDNRRLALPESPCWSTTCLVQKEFWIPQGRNVVKKILRQCVVCRYDIRKAFKYPGLPPLPPGHVQYVRPFNCTGVDFMGAIKV